VRRALLFAVLAAGLAVVPAAAAAPPRNDNYLSSLRLNDASGALSERFGETVDTTEATTQGDLFDPSREGLPFGGSGPEPTTCGAASFGKTVWYDFVPPTPGAVSIRTTGFDSAFAVYEFSLDTAQLGKLIACENESPGPSEDRQIQRPLRAERGYTIQVGGVGGAGGPLEFAFEFFADRDGDELFDEAPDECLTLPGIPAFGGCPPVVRGASRVLVANVSGGVQITRLLVDRGDRGARIEVSCGRCGPPVRARVRGGGTVRVRKVEGRMVRTGESIRVQMTHPRTRSGRFRYGAFGRVVRWPITSSGLGRSRATCTRPGSRREVRCP
jgi:hypothetical protein